MPCGASSGNCLLGSVLDSTSMSIKIEDLLRKNELAAGVRRGETGLGGR